MHVFIDTNILLSFFHFSNEQLDALVNVFASHKNGAATVHLTKQVRDEFMRNRDNKIKDALRKFKEVRWSAQLPSFMKEYGEYAAIRDQSAKLQQLSKEILERADRDIRARSLPADALIKEIFKKSNIIETTPQVYSAAQMRMAIGNPPGKNSSLGDSINWTVLLGSVPVGNDLHVISEDGDYFSSLHEDAPHPFLTDEWESVKKSKLFVYRTLNAFMSEHFDGVAFPFDKEKDDCIDALYRTGSFAGTHSVIGELERFEYFSLKEVGRILDAAVRNNQFGWIVTDTDVSDFLGRVAVPRLAEIQDKDQRSIVEQVIESRAGNEP